MKLLINLCAHDGIISHYAGVGTIVRRYIEVIRDLFETKKIDYHLNLFTLEFNKDSMGYNEELLKYHKSLKNTSLYILSNGTNGETSFGNVENYRLASKNTADVINKIDFSNYDYVITLCNDTPYAGLLSMIKEEKNSIKAWIPHSTAKIYNEDMSLSLEQQLHNERINWEQAAIDYINSTENNYLISTGSYIRNHLLKEYSLSEEKNIDIINGEILSRENTYDENIRMREILDDLNQYDSLILSLGRAEKYKNLDKTMLLGKEMNVKAVVITRQYYEGQPIISTYKDLASKTNSILYVDEPFFLPQYIVKHYAKLLIMLIPSEREIFGLVINEMRRFNKDNVLIVANDRGGLHEQINDGIDGVLVDLDNIKESAKKIKKYFNEDFMRNINKNGQLRLRKDYDLLKNFNMFLKKVIDEYE